MRAWIDEETVDESKPGTGLYATGGAMEMALRFAVVNSLSALQDSVTKDFADEVEYSKQIAACNSQFFTVVVSPSAFEFAHET